MASMMGPTHAAIGTATAMAVCALARPSLTAGAILVGTAMVCSKLPDQLEMGILRHRGPTHWLLTAAIVTTLIGFVPEFFADARPYSGFVWAGALIGYLMHIAADMCTVSGVEVLGPFDRRDRHLLPRGRRFVTGKLGDGFIGVLATAASVALAFMLLPHA